MDWCIDDNMDECVDDGNTDRRTDESLDTCMCECHLIHLTTMTRCNDLECEPVQNMHLLSCNYYY